MDLLLLFAFMITFTFMLPLIIHVTKRVKIRRILTHFKISMESFILGYIIVLIYTMTIFSYVINEVIYILDVLESRTDPPINFHSSTVATICYFIAVMAITYIIAIGILILLQRWGLVKETK